MYVTNGAGIYVRTLSIPFWQSLQIGAWFIPLFIFIIVATSNSVNITDWLDWLAGWLLLFSYAVYTYITYTQWLFLLSTLCVTIIWALIAFLWYNIKPAKFYMGDVWSLALWANLWIMAMLTNTIFVLIIVGALFIFETYRGMQTLCRHSVWRSSWMARQRHRCLYDCWMWQSGAT